MAGQLSPFADIDLSEHAIGANPYFVPKRCTSMSEIRTETNPTGLASPVEREVVVRDSKVTSENPWKDRHRVGEKKVRLMPSSEAGQTRCRKYQDSHDSDHGLFHQRLHPRSSAI